MNETPIPVNVETINKTINTLARYNKHVYAESETGSRHVVYEAYQDDDKIIAETPVGQQPIRKVWIYR